MKMELLRAYNPAVHNPLKAAAHEDDVTSFGLPVVQMPGAPSCCDKCMK
jgi:hypothetical protein